MKNAYESPFNSRYASREMQELFSPDMKFKTWRRLWIALAEAEKELGPKFDIRQFHNQLLDAGSLPLDLLEQKITKWIAATRGSV